jgi:FkbM family methyltransferase
MSGAQGERTGMAEGAGPEARFERARELIEEGKRALAEGHRELRALSGEVRPARARGAIHQMIWDCERLSAQRMQFFSRSGQDAFLDEHVFKGARGGVFVDLGGFDGLTGSNTLFFELMRGWSGLLVEPAAGPRAKAAEFRRCPCLPVAVGDAAGEAEFLEVEEGLRQMSGILQHYGEGVLARIEAAPGHSARRRPVRMRSLSQILDSHHLREVDLVSLDVNGAELAALQAFPFEEYTVRAWSIDATQHGEAIATLMQRRGYRRLEALGTHDVYLHESVSV